MLANSTLPKLVALTFSEFSWQKLHCPIHGKKNGLCIKIFKNFVPCRIPVYRPKKVGFPSLNILSRLWYLVLHLVSFFIAVNTTKDFLDFMEYNREYLASVTSCFVLVITFLDVIIVSGIAQSVSTAMIRDHRLTWDVHLKKMRDKKKTVAWQANTRYPGRACTG